MYSLRNGITVSWFVLLHIVVTGHWLFLSTSSWISSPGVFGSSILVFFWFEVSEILVHTGVEQVFDFFSISSRLFGNQNMVASQHVLLIPGCPKCRALSAAYLRDFRMIIRSSTMIIPQRWVNFLATAL